MASSSSSIPTDWSLCFFCQIETKETLRKPKDPESCGYKTLASNIPVFHQLGALPLPLNVSRLDDGSGIEETLRKNCATYHESCRLLFKDTKLERAKVKCAERRKSSEDLLEVYSSPKVKRQRTCMGQPICFICDKEDVKSKLRQVETIQTCINLKEMATELNDIKLLKSLSTSDPIAQELKYHTKCLASIHNRLRCLRRLCDKEADEEHLTQSKVYPLVFSELVTYIHEQQMRSEKPVIFKLNELTHTFSERLIQLGVETPDVHATRLKERLLHHIPQLEAYKQGKLILLAFKKEIGPLLSKASDYEDAIIVTKAAQILRKQMLGCNSEFPGNFDEDCINNCVPQQLTQFVSSISHGADIKSQLEFGVSKTDLALSHLLQFNCHKAFKDDAMFNKHSVQKETAFPVYLGLSVYSKTRKKDLVNLLYKNGLSVSYDRVLAISNAVGESVVSRYAANGIVCPSKLKSGIFTTAAIDNIDHNPSSTTASSSFHGTSISLFQHTPGAGCPQEIRNQLTNDKVKKISSLPDVFTNVKPTNMSNRPQPPPAKPDCFTAGPPSFYFKQEFEWLEKVSITEDIDHTVKITWSAHHASQMRGHQFEVGISTLLPLLRDQAHNVATVKHVMDRVTDTVAFLNPGQTPVIAADQPLFALAKQIQWSWPNEYENYVIMFGGLHIEMAILKMIGHILKDSGWATAIEESGIATAGTSESFLHATNITKCWRAHQITACALYKLLKTAHEADRAEEENCADFDAWCKSKCAEQPSFMYWHTVLELELSLLMFIHSFREGNFDAYKKSIENLMPYLFANDNTHYSRWLTVHLNDMLSLGTSHPDVEEEFQKGHFVLHKSAREFSGMPLDQAHEHNNAVVKTDGGAIGITENPSSLLRWMTAGLEICQLVDNYEMKSGNQQKVKTCHHEDIPSAHKRFHAEVGNLTRCIEEFGSPFTEESDELLTLVSKQVSGTHSLYSFKQKGDEQFQSFRKNSEHFYDPIQKNKFVFFANSTAQNTHKSRDNRLKQDRSLFASLFIICQNRQLDLDEFFTHENQPSPPALSNNGDLYCTQKSELINALEDLIDTEQSQPQSNGLLVDGSVLVHSLRPTHKTFGEYAETDFATMIGHLSQTHARVDIVFDQYKPNSLKTFTRMSRDAGSRRKVTPSGKVPKNWSTFLRNDTNKSELFALLAQSIYNIHEGIVYATLADNTVCNKISRPTIACSHEEADTRLFVHLRHAVEHDCVTSACILSK